MRSARAERMNEAASSSPSCSVRALLLCIPPSCSASPFFAVNFLLISWKTKRNVRRGRTKRGKSKDGRERRRSNAVIFKRGRSKDTWRSSPAEEVALANRSRCNSQLWAQKSPFVVEGISSLKNKFIIVIYFYLFFINSSTIKLTNQIIKGEFTSRRVKRDSTDGRRMFLRALRYSWLRYREEGREGDCKQVGIHHHPRQLCRRVSIFHPIALNCKSIYFGDKPDNSLLLPKRSLPMGIKPSPLSLLHLVPEVYNLI